VVVIFIFPSECPLKTGKRYNFAMVQLVSDLGILKEHATYCNEVLYRVESLGGAVEKFRIRIMAGRLGFDQKATKEEVEEIRSWLGTVNAIEIIGSVEDSNFFL
jgi:hypothetical protein